MKPIERLRGLPGVGEWTAQYIAMRELREADAFPAADLGLMRAMAMLEGAQPSPKAASGAGRIMATVARLRSAASLGGRGGANPRPACLPVRDGAGRHDRVNRREMWAERRASSDLKLGP